MEVSVQLHAPADDTHWIGGWVGPRAGVNRTIPISYRESNPSSPARTLVAILIGLPRFIGKSEEEGRNVENSGHVLVYSVNIRMICWFAHMCSQMIQVKQTRKWFGSGAVFS